MSEIRVTYSGLISFIAGLVTLGTGLVFTIIVSRSLSQLDYGTWGLITSLFVYGVLASEIINFWTVRDVARGKKVGKLSLVSSSSLSSIGICIYLVIALLVAPESSVEINFLIKEKRHIKSYNKSCIELLPFKKSITKKIYKDGFNI